MVFSKTLTDKATKFIHHAKQSSLKLATAESCTGGLLSALITDIPGSSSVFECGFITYANRAKIEHLTVPSYFIEEYGAVSSETALAMAEGALLISRADIALSITGIAGPDGGTKQKPVGTVFIALASSGKETFEKHFTFSGSRQDIRMASVNAAIDLLLGFK
jgi:nicotinamide-nucleotide amidase